MLALHTPFETTLHKIPVGAKLLALVVVTTGLFLTDALSLQILVMLGIAAVYWSQGTKFLKYGFSLLRPIWIFVGVIAVWHFVTADIYRGTVISLRMITAVACANLVTCTTKMDDLIDIVVRGLAPLQRFGVKPKRVGMLIALFLRFAPVLIEKSGKLQDSFRARSAKRATWKTVLPLAVIAIDDAEHVAEALRARGGIDGL